MEFSWLDKIVATELEKSAAEIAASAKQRVRRQTPGSGALEEAVRFEYSDHGVRIMADTPYARFVEFGTRTRPARPFLLPAFRQHRRMLMDRLQNALEERLKG